MSEAGGAKRAGRETGAGRTFEEGRDGREVARLSGLVPGQEYAAERDRATGGDEILRTEHGGGNGRPTVDGSASVRGRGTQLGADGGRRFPGHGRTASGTTDETYGGWVPTGVLLTPAEVLAAVLVAEIGWGLAMLVLALAERLAELPELVARLCLDVPFRAGLRALRARLLEEPQAVLEEAPERGTVTPAWPRHGGRDGSEDR